MGLASRCLSTSVAGVVWAGLAESTLAQSTNEIPFDLFQNYLVVMRGSLGGMFEVAWPFVTVRIVTAGVPVRVLVDTGSADLVLFKSRLPKSLTPQRWHGDKTVQYASGPARLLRIVLPAARLGNADWDAMTAFALDRDTAGYPPSIDGVLGVRTLGASLVQFDFEHGQFGWNR